MLITALAAACLAGCGSAATSGPPAAVIHAVRPASSVSGAVLALGSGDHLISDVGSDGQGRTTTRVLVTDPGGKTRNVRLVPGAWALPAAVPGQREGISWDGSRVVLVDTHDRGRFVALATSGTTAERPQVIKLPGRWIYDGVATDGRMLFLTELATKNGAPAYRIRGYDLVQDKLITEPIVDKYDGGEAMAGTPVARASNADFIYTVYERGTRPFVHALHGDGAFALCLDLPKERAHGARGTWFARRDGLAAAVISNGTLRTTYRLTNGRMTRIAYADALK